MKKLLNAQKEEVRHVLRQLLAIRGLLPLLMKPRNGEPWTPAEKAELLVQLRRLSSLSPYLLLLLLPGSALLLPAYAWWLDRRRLRRREASPASPESERP